MKINCVDLGQR